MSPSAPSSALAFRSALVFSNEAKPDAARLQRELKAMLEARRVRCTSARPRLSARDLEDVDLVIALGGDGTMLRAARAAAQRGVPLLGVNSGTLGFLSTTEPAELKRCVEAVLAGRHTVRERSMLRAEVLRGGRRVFGPELALNECVIRSEQARAVTLSTRSGGRFVADYFGDGLIVATPTGSTAYALAASGPIVEPSLDVTLLTPICPHTLTQRPLILPAAMALSVTLERRRPGESPRVLVSLDGREGARFRFGDELRVSRAETPLRLVMPAGRSYFDVLRRKLKWGAL